MKKDAPMGQATGIMIQREGVPVTVGREKDGEDNLKTVVFDL